MKQTGQSLTLLIIVLFALVMTACRSSTNSTRVAKPRYHHTWYKNHVYKKKWHIGRLRFHPEKQGVKQVRMKN